MVTIFLTTTGGLQSFTVPGDWNNANNSVECIGAGGGGSIISGHVGMGGGGGAYSKTSNLSLSGTASYQVGTGGGPATDGEDTWFNGANLAASSVGAKGGKGAIDASGNPGAGGDKTAGIGTTRNSGGAGGGNGGDAANGGGGGGGAAGPNGDGKNGGDGGNPGSGAGGGGGAGGGSSTAGFAGIVGNGGNGGTAQDGTPGGSGAVFGGAAAQNGLNGSGGGGGSGDSLDAGLGGQGIEFDGTHGSGGGGGGGGGSSTSGKAGGLYGGGGGGGAFNSGVAGSGAQGLIVIIYQPTTPIPPTPPTPPPTPPRPPTPAGMVLFPCAVNESCPGSDFPVLNVTSEDPDSFTFIGRYFGQVVNDPTVILTDPPYINQQPFTAQGCIGVCESSVSQEDADLCAQRQQVECITDMHRLPSPPAAPPGPPIQVFGNEEQTCVFHCPDGLPFSFTVPAGSFLAINQVLADREAHSYACRQAALTHLCLSSLSENEACANTPYNGTITVQGNIGDFTQPEFWELTDGSLPHGLTFDGGFRNDHMATITGTPTQDGTFTFTVRVTNFRGDTMQKQYTLCVIAITPSTLPDAFLGVAYAQTLSASSCAQTNIEWTVTSGALPDGLQLELTTGNITGTPTTNGTFHFTVQSRTGVEP